MDDKKFWDIADMYEEADKEGQSYVPAKDIKKLVRDVFEANNHDYDESLADISLFQFKVDSNRAINYLDKISKVHLQKAVNAI